MLAVSPKPDTVILDPLVTGNVIGNTFVPETAPPYQRSLATSLLLTFIRQSALPVTPIQRHTIPSESTYVP